MNPFVKKCLVPAAAGLASLSFTTEPTVPAVDLSDSWEAATALAPQAPQGPQGQNGPQKKTDDDNSFVGLDDLSLTSWPGLGTVSGLSTLPSPLGGSPAAAPGGGTGGNRSPKIPQAPSLPQSRVVPTAPVEPLSQYMP